MAGFKLKEGQFDNKTISEDEFWSTFNYVFSSRTKNTASYKFGFLKSIIDNLYNADENLILTFNQLFSKFAEIYWNLILKYGIRQQAAASSTKGTLLEQILHESVAQYGIAEDIPFESLSYEMMSEISRKVKIKCKTNVVGALYGDTKGLLYSFSKKEEWIQLNPQMYKFLCRHKGVIEKLNYYEWAKFLERVNKDTTLDRLLGKIDESTKRNSLFVYRQLLYMEFENRKCFYCGAELTIKNAQVDHFIPWSFIKDDNIWNFVLTCSSCNQSKSDKLTDDVYLDALIERNEAIFAGNGSNNENYKSDKLRDIFNWAKMNGYDDMWKPKKVKV